MAPGHAAYIQVLDFAFSSLLEDFQEEKC
jgi:hypothetical protein